jgi:serine/threonine protein kinase
VSLDLPDHVRTWEFGWNDVRIDHVLGVGSFGKVFLATLNEAPIAIKVLIDAQTHTSGPSIMDSKLVEEAGLLAALRHPNIVNFLGFCTVPPSIATEYCARGSVFDILQEADAAPRGPLAQQLSWPRRVKMVIDAAAGMLYLHTRTPVIIHRDIKSPNLLVTTDWTVKIADFNLSRLLDDTKQAASTIGGGPGNPRWLAPEILQGIKASPASDVYSFGVVMWEMLMWQLPWGDTNSFSVSVFVV